MRTLCASGVLVLGCLLAGCGGDLIDADKPRRAPAMGLGGQMAPADLPTQPASENQQGTPKPPPPAAGASPQLPPPPPPPPANPPKGSPTAGSPGQSPSPSPGPNADVQQTAVRPGVSGKGQYGPGIITTPLSVYFTFRERTVFDMQIPHTMNAYRAMHGHYPKTHEEFMEKIIRKNNIQLPKLRDPDARYVYLPEKAAKMRTYDPADPPLVIERPRR